MYSLVYMVEHHEEPDVLLLVELAPGEPLRPLAMLRPFVGSVRALPKDVRHRLGEVDNGGHAEQRARSADVVGVTASVVADEEEVRERAAGR